MSGHVRVSGRRADVVFAVAALAAVGVLAWIVITMQQLSHDLRTANEARDALAKQVQQLGGKPVAGPPGSRGESRIGPRGLRGYPGPPGPSGSPGESGKGGKSGSDGSDGVGSPGPSGAPGANGDSVVGPAGPQGERGDKGERGADGSDGRDGQTCPDGYSLQPPADDPDALVCRRDGAPDPEPGNGNGQPQAGALDPQRRLYL